MKALIISLFTIFAVTFTAAGEELHARLTVTGSRIDVDVRYQDGRAAADVPIRLLYGRQLTTAVAHTDRHGRWSHEVAEPGAYLAVIEDKSDAQNALRLPFTVLSQPEAMELPWTLLVPCLAGILGAGLAFVIGISRLRWPSADGISARHAFLMAGLMTAGAALLGWSAWVKWVQAAPVPTGTDVAAGARSFLAKKQIKPLSAPLKQLLAPDSAKEVKTQSHAMLNQPAPDFELSDHRGKKWRLHDQLTRGPVVLIFYYGYHCNHCVAQLFALHDDMRHFRELGAEVLAVSADPPEMTRDRFKQYGEFAFPVLSDPENKTGQAYGIYQPGTANTAEDLKHGTFVIGQNGRIAWVHTGYEPFTGNRTLLRELAR